MSFRRSRFFSQSDPSLNTCHSTVQLQLYSIQLLFNDTRPYSTSSCTATGVPISPLPCTSRTSLFLGDQRHRTSSPVLNPLTFSHLAVVSPAPPRHLTIPLNIQLLADVHYQLRRERFQVPPTPHWEW